MHNPASQPVPIPAGRTASSASFVDTVLDGYLVKGLEWLTGLLMLVDVVVVSLSVVWRYFLHDPFQWAEEVACLLLIWITFIGGAVAMQRHGHMSVNILVNKFSRRWQAFVNGLILTAQIAFSVFLTYQGYLLVARRLSEVNPLLPISTAWFVVPVPLCAAIMAITLLRDTVKAFRRDGAWLGYGVLLGILLALVLSTSAFGYLANINPVWILTIVTGVMIALNAPIAIALGGAAVSYLVMNQTIPMVVVPQRMVSGVNSFVMLALPFFILAGNLMETGGISSRLVNFASALVGHLRGGLAMVVVVTEMLFSGISGSITADVSAVGSMLIPAMGKAGYDKGESAAVVSAASAMGVLIPPCLFMVVIGSNFNISIAALFLGGFIPAFVLAVAVMVIIWMRARRENWPRSERLTWRQKVRVFVQAIVPLMLPVIIFGGVLGGMVTVTEAAVLAVVYALFVGLVFYREVTPKQAMKTMIDSGVSSGTVLWLVGASSIFSWILARQSVPTIIGQWIETISGSPVVFVSLAIIVFVLLGGVLEGLPGLLILSPIFMPISAKFGFSPIHFATVMMAAIGLGVFLPPVGVGLFISGSVAQVDMGHLIRKFWGYMVALLVGLFVVALVPWLTLVLPQLFM